MANGMLTISLQAHWQIEARGSDGEGRCRARARVFVRKRFRERTGKCSVLSVCDVEPFRCNQKIGVFLQVTKVGLW